jgi:hypothetical protein
LLCVVGRVGELRDGGPRPVCTQAERPWGRSTTHKDDRAGGSPAEVTVGSARTRTSDRRSTYRANDGSRSRDGCALCHRAVSRRGRARPHRRAGGRAG